MLQALAQADAIDAKADSGEDIKPLCGLPLAVKDSESLTEFQDVVLLARQR